MREPVRVRACVHVVMFSFVSVAVVVNSKTRQPVCDILITYTRRRAQHISLVAALCSLALRAVLSCTMCKYFVTTRKTPRPAAMAAQAAQAAAAAACDRFAACAHREREREQTTARHFFAALENKQHSAGDLDLRRLPTPQSVESTIQAQRSSPQLHSTKTALRASRRRDAATQKRALNE